MTLPLFRLRWRVLSAFFLFFFSATFSLSTLAWAEPKFALWAEVEGKNRIFDTKEEFSRFLEFSGLAGITDIYCQVFRGGKSWFPSMLADDAPFRKAIDNGYEPLRGLIDEAHRRGQKVHAWFNVLRVEGRSAPIIISQGRNAALIDNFGNSLLEYDQEGRAPKGVSDYRLDTPGIWLDSSSPVVRRYLIEVVRDVLLAYPDLDGIHLDMVRFPFARTSEGRQRSLAPFGYSRANLLAFKSVHPEGPASGKKAWTKWRRDQLTSLVAEMKKTLDTEFPGKELSAAVLASQFTATDYALQDWGLWMKHGYLDTAVPMNYTTNSGLFKQQSRYAARVRESRVLRSNSEQKVIIGLGAWLLVDDSQALKEQVRFALNTGLDGVCLFSFSNLLSSQGRELVQATGELIAASSQHRREDKLRKFR